MVMGKLTILTLRTIIVALFAFVLLMEGLVPLFAKNMKADLEPGLAYVRVPFLAIVILSALAIQVILVCVWRLVTMVRRGQVFSHGAFRYVDLIFGAMVTGSAMVLAFAVLWASANRRVEDEAAPGLVILVGGVAVAIFGMALVVLVLRTLLAQAVGRDAEAARLQIELDEVI
jgi:hypothetical protein